MERSRLKQGAYESADRRPEPAKSPTVRGTAQASEGPGCHAARNSRSRSVSPRDAPAAPGSEPRGGPALPRSGSAERHVRKHGAEAASQDKEPKAAPEDPASVTSASGAPGPVMDLQRNPSRPTEAARCHQAEAERRQQRVPGSHEHRHADADDQEVPSQARLLFGSSAKSVAEPRGQLQPPAEEQDPQPVVLEVAEAAGC